MKFARIFPLTMAMLGANTRGVAATDPPVLLDMTVGVEVSAPMEEKAAVESTIIQDLEPMVGEELGVALGGGRRRNRDLVYVHVLDGQTFSHDILNSDDEWVTITWNSVDYVEREVSCAAYGLSGDVCWQIYLQYRAVVTPAAGFSDNVDDLTLPHIPAEWKEAAKNLLKQHVTDHYEGKVYTNVRVDDHIYISTWGDPHFKTFSGSWFGKNVFDFVACCISCDG